VKCVEIDQQQASAPTKLSNEQWQALTALHRTLLHEHHDFFLASQHPSSSPALRRLAIKYAMPARMWRHGIHGFLRHRLLDSLEQMLTFVYLAYSMMALMESVPSFEGTWIECLGDLARYWMAIEETDLRDREVWSGVARMWYNKAADKPPNAGRIQHHLAVLARPDIVQQLFYYSKALVSVAPFQNARESIMLLFNPFGGLRDCQSTISFGRKSLYCSNAHLTAMSLSFEVLSFLQGPPLLASFVDEDERNLELPSYAVSISSHFLITISVGLPQNFESKVQKWRPVYALERIRLTLNLQMIAELLTTDSALFVMLHS
jgi:hypothetical protein